MIALSAITLFFFHIPLVRCAMDGVTYRWEVGPFEGAGVGGDFWFLLVGEAFACITLWRAWRGLKTPAPLLLVVWNAVLFALATWLASAYRDDFTFGGATLGIEISLALIAPLVTGLALAGAVALAVGVLRRSQTPQLPLRAGNRAFGALALILLPVQLLLFRSGEPHGQSDEIGVFVTMGQWVIFNLALYPWRGSPSSRMP